MSSRRSTISQGLIAGLIGYFVFVLFFAILNLSTGRSMLFTPNALGNALFRLGEAPGITSPEAVMAWNGVHLVASLTIGLIGSLLIVGVDRHPALWYVVMFLFIAGLLYSVAVGGVVAREIAGAVTWGQVVAVNVLAAFFSGLYLWRAHPTIRQRVQRLTD